MSRFWTTFEPSDGPTAGLSVLPHCEPASHASGLGAATRTL
jgi:hypothetical protein